MPSGGRFLPSILIGMVATPALAGGLYVSEFGISDMGAAGSGMLAGGSQIGISGCVPGHIR